MSVPVFTVAFIVLMIGMAFLLLLNYHSFPVVKAGKVDKWSGKTRRMLGYLPAKKLVVNGRRVDVSKDKKMVVCGNSMKDYHIFDGQRIYVKPLSDAEKREIVRFPVLVLNIVDHPDKSDADYKLRKFVGYAASNDWGKVYEQLRERIKIPQADFETQCVKKYAKLPQAGKERLVVSETYDEASRAVQYSLHPVSAVYGKVEYVL